MMPSQDTVILNKLFSLKKSKFRSKFRLTLKDRDYITAKGLETIKDQSDSGEDLEESKVASEETPEENTDNREFKLNHNSFGNAVLASDEKTHVVEVSTETLTTEERTRLANIFDRRRIGYGISYESVYREKIWQEIFKPIEMAKALHNTKQTDK